MPKALDTKQFIEKAIKVHGDKYDYSKSNYKHSKSEVTIICPTHGEFNQTPNNHLKGSGCKQCGITSNTGNKEQFIEKAIKVHGDKYDYSKSDYKDSKSEVTIICPIHGEFHQTPASHLQGRGCKQCGIESTALSQTGNKEQFIEKAIKVHGDKYDYSKSDYENTNSKITIICPTHGEFNQTPNSHLQGRGCKQCGIESQTGNKEQFIEDAIKVHGDKYDYSKIDYTKSYSKITIICPTHGEFNQTPNSHLTGHGCKQCGIESQTGNKEQFIEDAIKVHSDKYDYSKSNYVNDRSKITIICPIHGEFNQTPNSHLEGHGCKQCGIESMALSLTGNKEQFIEDAIKVHGDKYDYSKSNYVNAISKITIICPIHGEFNQTPNSHLAGQGCKQCGITSQTKDKEQFIEDAIKVHGDKYDYSKSNYVNAISKITIICPIHGEFNQTPHNHLAGQGCKQCGIDKFVEKVSGENHHNWNPDREYIKLRKRISQTCSQFIRRILKYTGGKKNNKAEIILGYTRTELMNHIENHENWNDLKHTDYHIDHIFPVKAFVDHNIEDPKIICALDNLRPLSAFDNISKNDNYDNNEFYKYMSRKYGKKKCSQWNIPFIYT